MGWDAGGGDMGDMMIWGEESLRDSVRIYSTAVYVVYVEYLRLECRYIHCILDVLYCILVCTRYIY